MPTIPFLEQVISLTKFLDALMQPESEEESEFHKECKDLIRDKKLKDLIAKFYGVQGILLEKAPNREVEGCLGLMMHIAQKLTDSNLQNKIITESIEGIVSNPEHKPHLRLKLLGNIYNLSKNLNVSAPQVLLKLLQFSIDSNQSEALLEELEKIDLWINQFGEDVTLEETRSIRLLAREILAENDKKIEAHKELIKYLKTFKEGEEKSIQEYITAVVVEAVQIPEIVEDFDVLLSIPVLSNLDTTNPELHSLLKLFATENLEALQKFMAEYPDFLESKGLVSEQCIQKIRLLSLASLASESSEIPYSLVATTLDIDPSEVETWIVKAISANILDAKLEQTREVVAVHSATPRVFTMNEWKHLAQSLDSWKQAIVNTLELWEEPTE
eukprot:CAMPEP_0174260346 /NCGR_PEP_ID=MMETSP0439-20130205/9653_1 /TAXON_ID=0 /ORGANISM="Stereomyxa ramosa, Strain Chinc5" /LENGTH=385 /DNA_ID=CAMNT_0015344569 /DNA_START=93 /DNA_END=1250 /DNA_ORIENTATION=-